MLHVFHKGLAPILCLLLFAGCQNSGLKQGLSEGIIEYSISFPDMDPDGIMAGMLPDATTLKFKNGREVNELSAGMGVFKTTVLTDNNEQKLDYHLSILGKKLVSELGVNDLDQVIAREGTMNYIFTNTIDTIAGYPCKKAIVVYNEIGLKEIEVYYTEDIAIKNVNWYNPFREIPGVMLRYEFTQYDMRMRLEANSVVAASLSDEDFQKPAGFEEVVPERISKELSEVMGTFSM